MNTLYMFPPNETPAEDADIVAGEYVLGSLEAGDAAAIRLRADTDPALLFAIGSWQARLVPLTAMLMPVAPPNSLWVRLANEVGFLEAEAPVSMTPLPMPGLSEPLAKEVVASTDCIGPNGTVSDVTESSVAQTDLIYIIPSQTLTAVILTPSHPEPRDPGLLRWGSAETVPEWSSEWSQDVDVLLPIGGPVQEPGLPLLQPGLRLVDRLRFWQMFSGITLTLALIVALVAWTTRGGGTQSVAAIGVVNTPAPIYLAEADTAGTLRLTPLAIIAVPNGRDLQLWMIAPDKPDPVSLGVLPPGGRTVSLDSAPVEGTRFIISMEPRGGAPAGRITGQVLYGGTLTNR